MKQSDAMGEEVDAVVIGAGFSGLYALHKLRQDLGLKVRVFEAGSDVGGTWYWNRYPGARCDSEAFVYCYSFSEELLEEWRWSGKYPEQPELLEYLRFVTERLDLRKDITFDTRVRSAHYDAVDNRWLVATDAGEMVRAQFLITAVGVLASAPHKPQFDGLDSFRGDVLHTGEWPDRHIAFTGKRVGIIGTGSTGVQAIPRLAAEVDHLHVFQRTPQFTVPARHSDVGDDLHDWLQENYDEIWATARSSVGGYPWQHNGESILDIESDKREATLEELWTEGGFKFVFGGYRDVLTERRANDVVAEFIRRKIRQVVNDPATAERLMPVHFPFAARRPIIDTGYFETYNRDNVTLVDVSESPIEAVTPNGIRTTAGEVELDMIILATGFDAITGPFFRSDIRGRDGIALQQAWASGPASYLGLTVAGYPNMFTVVGPGSMFANYPVVMEHHVEWIASCISYMTEHGTTVAEASTDAQDAWMRRLDQNAERSLTWLADSWYNGANIPGKPKGSVLFFGSYGLYRQRLNDVAARHFEGITFA